MGEGQAKNPRQVLDEKLNDIISYAMEKEVHPVYLIGLLTTIATGISTDIRDQVQAKAGATDGK